MIDEHFVIIFPESDRAFCHDDFLSIYTSLKDCKMQSGEYRTYFDSGPVCINKDNSIYFYNKENAIKVIKRYVHLVSQHHTVPKIQLLFLVRGKVFDVEEWVNGKFLTIPENQW